MNYSEAVNYIENLQAEAGSDLSLKQVKYLADMIGNQGYEKSYAYNNCRFDGSYAYGVFFK